MSIGLLYERSENDENGIKLTAEELGIDLTFIPFRKIAVSISKDGYQIKSKGKDYTQQIKNTPVVLNRAQSKNRRLYAATTMEALGKKVINSSSIEFVCYSKYRTLLHFWKKGLPFPKTVYVPCDPKDVTKDGRIINNEKDIADLMEASIENGIVVKPDAGTHGKGIVLSNNHEQLEANIQKTIPSIINPVGVVAQEYIDKWFYDLRITVSKEKGKNTDCHPVAMARTGVTDFRTNTYLGNLVFDVKLPQSIQETAIKCGEALAENQEAWIFALDAMINVGSNKKIDDAELKKKLNEAAVPFEEIKKVKKDPERMRDFKSWNTKLEAAFKNYMGTEPYTQVKNIIEENIENNKSNIVFHEANSCPEFWENTRLITGMNAAVTLLKGAQSLI